MNDLKTFDHVPGNKADMLKRAVIENLDWTEMDYCNFQYEQGLIYIETYLSGFGEVNKKWLQALLESRIFWNWWKNHWTRREESYLITDQLPRHQRREIYRSMHNGRNLATEIHPNRVVLDESYPQMLHSVVKAQVKQTNF